MRRPFAQIGLEKRAQESSSRPFPTPSPKALVRKLQTLAGREADTLSRIEVKAIARVGRDLYAASYGPPEPAPPDLIRSLIGEAAEGHGSRKFSPQFLLGEWNDVVEPWVVVSSEDYGKIARLGRKTQLGGKKREAIWPVFDRVREALKARRLVTNAEILSRVATAWRNGVKPPYDFAVIDEAQDLGVAEARFLAALGASRPNGLFFAGDLGQRIFQTAFSWKALGIDIRGRSYTLRVNYRTSHQIRTQADRLLPGAIADVDGNEESRKGTVSMFDGPPPEVRRFPDADAEAKAVGAWIAARLREGLRPEEIGVFVRSEAEIDRARDAAKAAGVGAAELSANAEGEAGFAGISTMHHAKGLEFPAVAVMACDDEVLPMQERIEAIADDADLEEVYNTERHLLYVACTRARDRLLVTGVEPASEFLADFGASRVGAGPPGR
jgi:superfamily I DNA/RNA helicase